MTFPHCRRFLWTGLLPALLASPPPCLEADDVFDARGFQRGRPTFSQLDFEHIDPLEMPAVLVAGHGPFTWGADATASLDVAVALEYVAELAYGTLTLRSESRSLDRHLLDKHYRRKHGNAAYYGQD